MSTGVPQETILGPLLFILYVNDLLINIPNDTIVSYADDTAIVTSENTWSDTQDKMNEYLKEVTTWLELNKLSLNVNKTVYISFGNYKDSVPINIEIKINDKKLKRVEECRYLGIHFDFSLKWDVHIQYIINKTKYLVYIFYKLNKIMLTKILMMIYYAFFSSIINYDIIAWGGAYQNN